MDEHLHVYISFMQKEHLNRNKAHTLIQNMHIHSVNNILIFTRISLIYYFITLFCSYINLMWTNKIMNIVIGNS